jgi:DNA repair ATPase RecN
MLSRVAVRHFQSLHDVEVTLDRFTVIVGASSSGKSAFTRALRTLSSNARGTSFIEHGESTATITADTDDGSIVSLSKGKVDQYTLIPREGDQLTFTKLHGEVPEKITAALGIQAKDPINYAGQFDMPYLLRASPSEVARILGELTNADIVFNAAKESNRRRLQGAGVLKVKVPELEAIEARAVQYGNLRTQLDALESAESKLLEAKEIDGRIQLLDKLSSTYSMALQRHESALETSRVQVPSAEAAQAAQDRLDALIELLRRTSSLSKTIASGVSAVGVIDEEIQRLEGSYIDALHAAGKCPTCGQDTRGVAHV